MTIEFNGIEELMWCSAKIKKEDLLNKDQNFFNKHCRDFDE